MVVKHFHSGRVHDEEKIVPFLWRGAFYVKNPNEGESPFLYYIFFLKEILIVVAKKTSQNVKRFPFCALESNACVHKRWFVATKNA